MSAVHPPQRPAGSLWQRPAARPEPAAARPFWRRTEAERAASVLRRPTPRRVQRAQLRVLGSLSCTVLAVSVAFFGGTTHAGFVPLALLVTGLCLFATLWFVLDLAIAARTTREQALGSGLMTPMTGARDYR